MEAGEGRFFDFETFFPCHRKSLIFKGFRFRFTPTTNITTDIRFGWLHSPITEWMKLSILRARSSFMFGVACAYVLRVNDAVAWPRFSCSDFISSPALNVYRIGVSKIMKSHVRHAYFFITRFSLGFALIIERFRAIVKYDVLLCTE